MNTQTDLLSLIHSDPSWVHEKSPLGNTLLHIASRLKWYDAVERLLKLGADPEARNNKNEVALTTEFLDTRVTFSDKSSSTYSIDTKDYDGPSSPPAITPIPITPNRSRIALENDVWSQETTDNLIKDLYGEIPLLTTLIMPPATVNNLSTTVNIPPANNYPPSDFFPPQKLAVNNSAALTRVYREEKKPDVNPDKKKYKEKTRVMSKENKKRKQFTDRLNYLRKTGRQAEADLLASNDTGPPPRMKK